jgi:hypothetical protein
MKLLTIILLVVFAALAVQGAPEADPSADAKAEADPFFFFPFFGGGWGREGGGWGRRHWGWRWGR